MPQNPRVIPSSARNLLSLRGALSLHRHTRSLIVSLVGMTLFAASASAQAKIPSIDPGMTRAQVVERLGEPLSARSFESFTYLLYKNGCEKKCGMNDLVVLDSGKVVDAVFRSPLRKYTGTSSSPRAIPIKEAEKDAPKPAATKPLTVKKPAR